MASITKTNQAGTPDDKKKKKKRILIGAVVGTGVAGLALGLGLGLGLHSSADDNGAKFGIENMDQVSNEKIMVSVPKGSAVDGYKWDSEADVEVNAATINELHLDQTTFKPNYSKYVYQASHQTIVSNAQGIGTGQIIVYAYDKDNAPTPQKLSYTGASKDASDEPVQPIPLFTKHINVTVQFVTSADAAKAIDTKLTSDEFNYKAGDTKAPKVAPVAIPAPGKTSASKDMTPQIGAALGLDIPLGTKDLPTYTVKGGTEPGTGTMTITHDKTIVPIPVVSGIASIGKPKTHLAMPAKPTHEEDNALRLYDTAVNKYNAAILEGDVTKARTAKAEADKHADDLDKLIKAPVVPTPAKPVDTKLPIAQTSHSEIPKTMPATPKHPTAEFAAALDDFNTSNTAYTTDKVGTDNAKTKQDVADINAAVDAANAAIAKMNADLAALTVPTGFPTATNPGSPEPEFTAARNEFDAAKIAFNKDKPDKDLPNAIIEHQKMLDAIAKAKAHKDPTTTTKTVYTYNSKDYDTESAAKTAARHDEEAKITSKTVFTFSGKDYPTKADAEAALASTASTASGIASGSWSSGTIPADGAVAPAPSTEHTVYIYDGKAYDTEDEASDAWLKVNQGKAEHKGSFKINYDKSLAGSFDIVNSVDAGNYPNEAVAKAALKGKFAWGKDGVTTGTKGNPEVEPPVAVIPSSITAGTKVKMDGTEYTAKMTPWDENGVEAVTFDDFAAGYTKINLDGKDYYYTSEKDQPAAPRGFIYTDEAGNTHKYNSIGEVLKTNPIHGFAVTYGKSTDAGAVAILDASLQQKLKDDLQVIADLKDEDLPDTQDIPLGNPKVATFLDAYRSIVLDVAMPMMYGTLKLSNPGYNTLPTGPEKLQEIYDDFKKQFSQGEWSEMFAGLLTGPNGGLDTDALIAEYAKMDKRDYSKVPVGFPKFWAVNASKIKDFAKEAIKEIGTPSDDIQPADNLMALSSVFSPSALMAQSITTPSHSGATRDTSETFGAYSAHKFAFSFDGVFIEPDIANSVKDKFATVSLAKVVDDYRVGKSQAAIYKPADVMDHDDMIAWAGPSTGVTTQRGMLFPTTGIYPSVTGKNDDQILMSETEIKGRIPTKQGVTQDKDEPIYRAVDGKYYTTKAAAGEIPPKLVLTDTAGNPFATPPKVYVAKGKKASDLDFVSDPTKGEGYVALVKESRVDHYKLTFDNKDVSGQTKDVPWTSGSTSAPAKPTIDETKITIEDFDAYTPSTIKTKTDATASKEISSETVSSGFDKVTAAGAAGTPESDVVVMTGGFKGFTYDGKFYSTHDKALAAFKTEHDGDITSTTSDRVYDGTDEGTAAAAITAADNAADKLITHKTITVPVGTSDEPNMDTTIDSVVIYA